MWRCVFLLLLVVSCLAVDSLEKTLNGAIVEEEKLHYSKTINIPEHVKQYLLRDEERDYSLDQSCDTNSRFTLDDDLPKPDFFVVGMNAATSVEIIKFMHRHPSFRKKPGTYYDFGFFAYPTINATEYQNSFENLQTRFFRDTDAEGLYGDYSISYFFHPLAPRRIATAIYKPKVIIILRNPIDRAYTQYLQSVSRFGEIRSFEEVIEDELKNIVEVRDAWNFCGHVEKCNVSLCIDEFSPIKNGREFKNIHRRSLLLPGIYYDAVNRWRDAVGEENLIILFHEDFYTFPRHSMRKITTFLNIINFSFDQEMNVDRVDEAEIKWEPMSEKTYQELENFYSPFNDKLFQAFDLPLGTDWPYYRGNVQ